MKFWIRVSKAYILTKNMKPILLILFAILILGSSLLYIERPNPQREFAASVVDALSSRADTREFARATKVRKFRFPDDAGPHTEFQTEWWYYTGNLNDEYGRPFGFQLTFFRRALTPNKKNRKSLWATNQVYFAHFTVSDIKDRAFFPSERWSRGAIGLAGADAHPFRVWLEDWSAVAEGKEVRLRAKNNSAAIDLKLTPTKPVVLHGNQGLSQKSAEPGNASYYYSQTRLDTSGTITIKGRGFRIQGFSWLDREWSTSSLIEEQSGWDWFSLQLSDNREIMLYQIRLRKGGIDPYSSGSLIESDGTVHTLTVEDFKIEVLDRWKSSITGTTYPSRWRINIPRYRITLTVVPHQPNQELPLTFVYWEGAVEVKGNNVSGNGYVELTGYARSPESEFGSDSTAQRR
jgi:predicted secreted hydrolase